MNLLLLLLRVLVHVHSIVGACACHMYWCWKFFLHGIRRGLALAPSGVALVCAGIRGATGPLRPSVPSYRHCWCWNAPLALASGSLSVVLQTFLM